jgi:hypothetical protein
MRRAFDLLGIWLLLAVPVALAAPIQVTIDTSAFSGAAATLAFDFIDGGPPANSVAIFGLATDGTLGTNLAIGGATGSLPGTVVLDDSSFFNEYQQNVTLGTFVTFLFEPTTNAANPGSLPDAFSVFLLDAATGQSLVATSDPTGSDALLIYNVGAANPITVYSTDVLSQPFVSALAVPALSPPLLVVAALALLALGLLPMARRAVKDRA